MALAHVYRGIIRCYTEVAFEVAFAFSACDDALGRCPVLSPPSPMKTFALRLHPHDDLQLSLQKWTAAKEIQAGCILSAVGNLEQATLRFADRAIPRLMKRKFELVSCVGTLSPQGIHIHLAIADAWGRVWGGHLMEGCLVHTSVEIVLAELTAQRFERHLDRHTGDLELKVSPVTPRHSTTPRRESLNGFQTYSLDSLSRRQSD